MTCNTAVYDNAPVETTVNGIVVSRGIALHVDDGRYGAQGKANEIPFKTADEEYYLIPLGAHCWVFACDICWYSYYKHNADKGAFDPQRENVFHYSLWCHKISWHAEFPGYGGWSLGIASDDFIVSLGDHITETTHWDANRDGTYDTWDKVLVGAGVFIHELGHDYGLYHGGNQNKVFCCPNYQSVMNYTYTVRGIDGPCLPGIFDCAQECIPGHIDHDRWCDARPDRMTLDYASMRENCSNTEDDDGDLLVDDFDPDCYLNEAHLNENYGVCGPCKIDWNGDGEYGNDVEADINNDAWLKDGYVRWGADGDKLDECRGFDDWKLIKERGMKIGHPKRWPRFCAEPPCGGNDPWCCGGGPPPPEGGGAGGGEGTRRSFFDGCI